jgi:hypothetical protein
VSRRVASAETRVLVTNQDGLWTRYKLLARAGLPRRLRAFVAGPARRLNLSFAGNTLDPRKASGPVDGLVADDLVLRTTLRLPHAARSSIASAVRLHALECTPFADGELLGHVSVRRDPDDADMLLCHVIYVPRSYIDRGLAEHGVRETQLRNLTVDESREAPIALLAAYAPKVSRRQKLATALPLALGLLAFATSWSTSYLAALSDLSQGSGRVALAEESVNTLAHRLAAEKNDKQAGAILAAALPGAGRSVGGLLKSVAAALPANAEIRRASLSGFVLELSLASPDLLADVRAIAAKLQSFRVELVGTVVAESPGQQAGTVRLTATMAEAKP